MPDVLSHLWGSQRRNGQPHCDPLFELSEILAVQSLIQFVLPNKHDLQELLVGLFEISQQTDFFEHFSAQLVCLIDDKGGDSTLLPGLEQKVSQHPQALGFAGRNLPELENGLLIPPISL